MGFLRDLIQRWFGAKPQETQRALPSPPPIDHQDRDREPPPPIMTAGLPWLAPVAEPSAAKVEPAAQIAAIEPPAQIVAIESPAETEVEPLAAVGAIEPLVAAATGPEPPVAIDPPAVVPPSVASPRAFGLAGDLGSPLGGDWGAIDPAWLAPEPPKPPEPPDEPVAGSDPAIVAEQRAARRVEFARRRQARDEARAVRRATDIRYLGRGVSEALNNRQGDRVKLERAGLPGLDTPGELANRLGISIPRLRWLAFHAEVATRVHYINFEVAKKGGGTRRLSAPHRSLALTQRWIGREIVAKLPTEDHAHGFVPGRSIVTNARGHAGQAVVVNLDLEGFFPSIGFRRVRAVFEQVGYSPAIATILGLLCTEAPRRPVRFEGEISHVAIGPRGLPQGACTSPGLSNQVARRLDRRLGGLATKLGAEYTRYADDLTFSGGSDLDPRVGYLLAQVRRIAASEGFTINETKTRVARPNTAQVVTGLVVNDRPGVARDEVRRLRAILHRARSEGLDAQNRDSRPDFRAWLLGKIAFVAMVRPEVGARLLDAYRAIDST